MADKGVIVASKAPIAFNMTVVDDYGVAKSHVINGNRHPTAINGMGITHGVDLALFDAWMKDHPEHGPREGDPDGMLQVLSEDDLKKHHEEVGEYGFQPGLDKADMTGTAEGSLETGHASTVDMAAHSYEGDFNPIEGDPEPHPETHPHSETPAHTDTQPAHLETPPHPDPGGMHKPQ